MRIAVIGAKGLPARSGAERVVDALLPRLAAHHRLTYYCDARYTPSEADSEGVRLVRLRTLRGKHTRALSLFVGSALHAVFFGRYDVVHVHNVEASVCLPLLCLRFPTVVTAHGTPGRSRVGKWGYLARFLMRLTELPFMRLATVATSVSEIDAFYLEARYSRSVSWIPNGVSIPTGLPKPLAPAPGSDEATASYLLFAAGRLDPVKGCHLLIEALRTVNSPARLRVIADGSHAPEYVAWLREAAADLDVRFEPLISDRQRLLEVLSGARLFIFPSLMEGMSMMLMEAASTGTPVLCSDIPENRAVLADHAIYFRSGDARDLGSQLDWSLSHPRDAEAIGAGARVWIGKAFDWDRIVPMYEAAYEEAVGMRQRRQHV